MTLILDIKTKFTLQQDVAKGGLRAQDVLHGHKFTSINEAYSSGTVTLKHAAI